MAGKNTDERKASQLTQRWHKKYQSQLQIAKGQAAPKLARHRLGTKTEPRLKTGEDYGKETRVMERVIILLVCGQQGGCFASLNLVIFNTSCIESTLNVNKGMNTFCRVNKKTPLNLLSKWHWFVWQSAFMKTVHSNSFINYRGGGGGAGSTIEISTQ